MSASTFSDDNATDGGAVDNGDNSGSGILAAGASIFSDGCDQAGGVWEDEGYNVGSDGTCLAGGTSDIDNGSSLRDALGPLSDNGGPTATILPLAGNPAIGVVPNPTSVTLNGTPTPLCPTSNERAVASVGTAACGPGPSSSCSGSHTINRHRRPWRNGPARRADGFSSDRRDRRQPGRDVVDSRGFRPARQRHRDRRSDGSFIYTPGPGFVGTDSFSYTLTDNLGYASAPATVSVDVALAFSVTANGAAEAATPTALRPVSGRAAYRPR